MVSESLIDISTVCLPSSLLTITIDDLTCGSRSLVQKLRNVGYDVQVALDAEEAIGLFRLYAVDADQQSPNKRVNELDNSKYG